MADNAAPVIESDYWCRTTAGDKASTTFTWTIEDFLSRHEELGESILSSPFTVSGPNAKVSNWVLELFPRGDSGGDPSDPWVSLYLKNTDGSAEKASFSWSTLNERGQKEDTDHYDTTEYSRVHNLCTTPEEWIHRGIGDDSFIDRQFLEENPDLLPGGNLTIVIELTVYGREITLSGPGSKFPDEKLAPNDNCLKQMSELVF